MFRKVIERLKIWKTGESRKPLLYVYINFENNPHMKLLFERGLDTDRPLQELLVESDCPNVPGEILILPR